MEDLNLVVLMIDGISFYEIEIRASARPRIIVLPQKDMHFIFGSGKIGNLWKIRTKFAIVGGGIIVASQGSNKSLCLRIPWSVFRSHFNY